MAAKKSPITPAAPCLYPFLKTPDTRWKKEGEYKVSLVFDTADEFIAKVEAKAVKEFEKAKANMKTDDAKKLKFVSPVKEELDESGKATGNVKISFKSNAQYINKKTEELVQVTMKVFDAQGKPIVNLPNIGNGSKLKVSFNPIGTVVKGEFYLSLWMNAVQLLELVEYKADGSSYGFGKEEGGYEASDDDAPFGDPASTAGTTGAAPADDADDF